MTPPSFISNIREKVFESIDQADRVGLRELADRLDWGKSLQTLRRRVKELEEEGRVTTFKSSDSSGETIICSNKA